MKKVLITGYTSRMTGSLRVRGDYITFVFVLEDILTEMGYEVERRQVNIGEQIAGNYYFAFCGVAPLNSISAHHVPETHYVMDQMSNRHAVFFDDWSACGFGKSIRGVLKDWGRYLKYKKFPYSTDILDATKENFRIMTTISVLGANRPVLAPMFRWGNHQFLMEDNYCAKLITIDPSAWLKYPSIQVPLKHRRIKQWVMAALSNHTAWVQRQDFRFPVMYIGNVRMPNGILISEDRAVQCFADNYGVLAVGYPSAGSGWWRSRYLNAAWAETPIYSDKRDAITMGQAYQGTPYDFESEYMTHKYDERVREQNIWLQKNVEKKDEVIAKLEELLK